MNPRLHESLEKLRLDRQKYSLVPREESIFIVERIDETCVADAMQELPASVRDDLEKLAAEEPRTDEGWNEWRGPAVHFLGILPDTSRKSPEAEQVAHRECYRRGIEAVRSYFAQIKKVKEATQ